MKMVDKPILRFPNPTQSNRRTGSQRSFPRARGPGRNVQGTRFQGTFDRLATALDTNNPEVTLRADPTGIAPERALVFVTAGSVQNFARAASDIGLEVFAESELDDTEDFPDGFVPPGTDTAISRTLYATMPTLAVFERILTLWRVYQRGEAYPTGAAPWWAAFDLLLELRPWGPEDRLVDGARTIIEDRLPFDADDEVSLELEIWPTSNNAKRATWRAEAEQRVVDLGGTVVDRSSIVERGFIYEGLLVNLPARAVREMLDDPTDINGLATVQGVQFILPQTIGQGAPGDIGGQTSTHEAQDTFDIDAPVRAVLLDGTPVAGHAALDGGVIIEDLHDLVRLSPVNQRYHATAMASLILRGDLGSDGEPLQDTRLVSVPLLIDGADGPWSPGNRLFVDLVHTTLTRLITGENPLAAEAFVVNFSIGVRDARFAGRISALARLLDWWAVNEGLLFVISAGNVNDNLPIRGVRAVTFEGATEEEQRQSVRTAIRASKYDRTLLSPAEALNGVTVGAISKDITPHTPIQQAGIIVLEGNDSSLPQLTSALGLGLNRAIKPDFLEMGGRLEARILPNGDDTNLQPLDRSQRTGLIVAAPNGGTQGSMKSRGTSAATALTTRAILKCAEALTGEDGPYEGQELPRRTLALLSRALAVNAARWPDDAHTLYDEELVRLGERQYVRAKEEVCRYFGHGISAPDLMQRSPDNGVTMVGFGSIRKDQARIFKMPLPASMSGDRVPRSMRATIAWFSPINPARAQYRLASLEAVVANDIEDEEDKTWKLDLVSHGPDVNMVKRGSVWSRRLVNRSATTPIFGAAAEIPICIQCRDTSNGGLTPDDDIAFALAVTLQIESEVQYDIHNEVEQQVRVRLRGNT